MEDLKERYYYICAKLANVRAAPGTDLKIPVFDAGHERRRKEQLERLYNRTPEQVMSRHVRTQPSQTSNYFTMDLPNPYSQILFGAVAVFRKNHVICGVHLPSLRTVD